MADGPEAGVRDRRRGRGESFRYRLEIEHADDGRQSRITWESLSAGPTTLFKCEMGDVHLYRGVLLVRESSTAVSARPLEALAANDGLKLSEQLARGWYA